MDINNYISRDLKNTAHQSRLHVTLHVKTKQRTTPFLENQAKFKESQET